jgi:acyl-CoA reductase-like NAD-dependent aldehyde dehydrogenase
MAELIAPDAANELALDLARVRMMVGRARWAAGAFSRLDRERTLRIAHAAAEAGFARAAYYAEKAVRETGFGVAEDKRTQIELCTRGTFGYYRRELLVGTRLDPVRRLVAVARPAGVVFALTPSTNPVSTVLFKIICALLTRNAIIVSPHPRAKICSAGAARVLASAALRAGAPDGAIQVIDEPSLELNEALMCDPRIDVILATGGMSVLRAAHRSGNPAIGAGPGNVPVLVDATADAAKAAKCIAASKSFDNSLLSTSESVLIVEEGIADRLLRHLKAYGAHLCSPVERDRLRKYLFPGGRFEAAVTGKHAVWIAGQAGFRVPPKTKVLLAPFDLAVPEEPFCREKLFPVLGLCRVRYAEAGIDVSRAILRYAGGGHSAAIHSRDPGTIMAFASALKALRIIANNPCSSGTVESDGSRAPSIVIGTGYYGHSSVGEDIGPHHLINWSRISYSKDAGEALGYCDEPEGPQAKNAV